MSGMFAELPVGFPLRLIVELIAGALVRERPVARAILQHVRRLIPGQRRLEIQDRPLSMPRGLCSGSCHERAGVPGRRRLPERGDVQFDLDAETRARGGARWPDRQRPLPDPPAIGDNDVAAVAADEFA